jgi:hypothetical protein
VKRTASALLVTLVTVSLGLAEETSFQRVKVPDVKGRQTKAVLTFSDNDKAVEVRPVKGEPVMIPYEHIDTKKHHITQAVIVGAISPAAGIIVFFTKAKSHWLEIDYHDQDAPKVFVLRMNKHDYVHILEAVNHHTGKDAEILGNVDKREK